MQKENLTTIVNNDIFIKTVKLSITQKINDNILHLLIEIDIFYYLEETIEELLKWEIKKKINDYSTVYDRLVLTDEIILYYMSNSRWFKKILLLWANYNMALTSGENRLIIEAKFNMYEEYFIEYIKTEFATSKIKVFFDIISNYPESHMCLNDFKECLNPKIVNLRNKFSKMR